MISSDGDRPLQHSDVAPGTRLRRSASAARPLYQLVVACGGALLLVSGCATRDTVASPAAAGQVTARAHPTTTHTVTRSASTPASVVSLSTGEQAADKNQLSEKLAALIAAEHLKGFASSYEEPNSAVLDVWWHGFVPNSVRLLAQHAAPAALRIKSAPYTQVQLSAAQTLLIKRFSKPKHWDGWIIGSITEPIDATGLTATIFRPGGGTAIKPSPELLKDIGAAIRNAVHPIPVLSVTVHVPPFAA